MAARNNGRSDNRQRLMEIVEVVRRHEITKGITPDKLCAIIEELGPTLSNWGRFFPCGRISCPRPTAKP